MHAEFSPAARRLGLMSAALVAVLLLAYAAALAAGFASLDSSDAPIGDPWFTVLEVLILVMMVPMVSVMVAVHAWAPPRLRVLSFAAVVFMALVAATTCALHAAILVLGRLPDHEEFEPVRRLLAFQWPSLAYAVDILAWDLFFPVSLLFASGVFGGDRLARWVRASMIVAALFALAGLAGPVTGDMALRNLGIVGYVGVFFVVVLLLGALFRRSLPANPSSPQGIGPK